jgi:hypothetical protein
VVRGPRYGAIQQPLGGSFICLPAHAGPPITHPPAPPRRSSQLRRLVALVGPPSCPLPWWVRRCAGAPVALVASIELVSTRRRGGCLVGLACCAAAWSPGGLGAARALRSPSRVRMLRSRSGRPDGARGCCTASVVPSWGWRAGAAAWLPLVGSVCAVPRSPSWVGMRSRPGRLHGVGDCCRSEVSRRSAHSELTAVRLSGGHGCCLRVGPGIGCMGIVGRGAVRTPVLGSGYRLAPDGARDRVS